MVNKLLSILKDEKRVITQNIEEKYLSDSLLRKHGSARAVVFPINTREVSEILKYAYENNIKVTPRGAGTNLVGSTVPSDNGIVIDMSLMNHILEIDEKSFTATVEPGVILENFQKEAESRGLFYPPDPGERRASIGGNISTNAGGMRAVKYGVTGDYVMGLELVLPNGKILLVGSKNRKDTSGLNIKDIIIGSEGTLAIITKCILKLLPKPEKVISVLIGYNSLKEGIEGVRKIYGANLNPTAMEFIEEKVVKLGEEFLGITFPMKNVVSYILLTFDGRETVINESIKKLHNVALESGAIDILSLDNPHISANVWKIRGALVKAVEAVSEQEPLDIVVPINKIDTFVKFVNELEIKKNIRMISFGHGGDGNIHICVVRGNRDEETWRKDLDNVLVELYKEAHRLGGLVSGEHGIGLSKQKYFTETTNIENISLMKNIKAVFDNRHIMNPFISYDIPQ